MIKEKLNRYFSDRGFSRVDLHMEAADLYYLSDTKSAQLVWIIDSAFAEGLDKETYTEFYKKIVGTFLGKGFEAVNTITLFLSSNPKKCLELGEGTAFWVVDESYGRIVVYENQPEDFLGIRLPIEKMVSIMLEGRIREAEANANEAAANARAAEGEASTKKMPHINRSGLRVLKYKPYMVYSLLIINVLIFILTDLLGTTLGTYKWLSYGSVSWMSLFNDHEYYRLFTAIFLHANAEHIMGNMLALFAAGEILENAIGHKRFIILYIVSGLMASFGSACFYYTRHTYTTSVGASGAIYAIIGALIVYFATHKEKLRYLGSGQIMLFIIYFGYTIYLGFERGSVDNAAHICGLLAGGFIYLIYHTINKARGVRD